MTKGESIAGVVIGGALVALILFFALESCRTQGVIRSVGEAPGARSERKALRPCAWHADAERDCWEWK